VVSVVADFGRNMKVTLGASQRAPWTAMMTDAFGATFADPMDAMRIFTLTDGFSLGAQFVEDAVALTPEQSFLAPWLEFRVPNLDATAAVLAKLGVESFEYVDATHTYYRAPGGLVFRLASSA
jgi:hypothetical protein